MSELTIGTRAKMIEAHGPFDENEVVYLVEHAACGNFRVESITHVGDVPRRCLRATSVGLMNPTPETVLEIGSRVEIIGTRVGPKHYIPIGETAKVGATYGLDSVVKVVSEAKGLVQYIHINNLVPIADEPKVERAHQPSPLERLSRLGPQCHTVLDHLLRGGKLTRLSAMFDYKIANITARITDLRDAGVEVACRIKHDVHGNRYGEWSVSRAEAQRVRMMRQGV